MAQAETAPQTARTAPGHARIVAEIAIAWGLIMAVIWTPRPIQRYLWIVAAITVVAIVYASFEGVKAMGLRIGNLQRSLWIVLAALLLSVTGIFVAARFGTLRLPNGVAAFIATYCAYSIWSGVQQFLLQGFFLVRFLRIMPNPYYAAFTAASLFAVAHLPNPILAPVTLLWGFAACLLFLRYRNLYPLAIAHAILGITVAMTIPGHVDHNMRVGLGYLTYGHRHSPYVSYLLSKP